MSNVNRIQGYFAQHREEILADLKALVAAQSPSGHKSGCKNCADEICRMMESYLGITPIRYPQEKYGDHMLFQYGNGSKKILFIGHYDTVWDIDSLPTREEDGKLYGPGVFDMKFGIVSAIWSVKALKELGIETDTTICYLFNSDEEVGSVTSKELILEAAKDTSAVLIMEPSEEGAIKTQRKGVGMFVVDIIGKATHAGAKYYEGISAIEEAAKLIPTLHGLSNRETGTTVNVGIISGGTRRNVVAAECRLEIDCRVETLVEAQRIKAAMAALIPSREGITLKVSGDINRPPMEFTPGNQKLFHLLKDAAAELDLSVVNVLSGGGSDGNFTSAAGHPTIDGMGAVGAGAHAVNEHINIEASLARIPMITNFILHI